MANGDDFTPEELREYVRPLELIRRAIDDLSRKEGIEVKYYTRGWPHIALTWNNRFDLACLVQLYMDTDKSTYILWAAASKDIDQRRYAQKKELHRGIKPPFDEGYIVAEMKKGIELCNSWKLEDLTLST